MNELIGTPQESSTPAPTSDQFHNAIMSGVGPSASSSNLPRLLFPPTNSTNNNRPQSARNPRLQLVSQQIEDILSTIITNARRIGSSDAGNDHIIESPTTTTTSSTDSFDDYFRQDRRDGRGEDIGIPTPARLIAIDRSVQRYRDFHRGGGGGGGGGEISSLIQEVNENPIPTTVIESSPIVEHDPEEEDFKL